MQKAYVKYKFHNTRNTLRSLYTIAIRYITQDKFLNESCTRIGMNLVFGIKKVTL